MLASRILPALLLVAGLALPAGAQVFQVFPYEAVSAFGQNNERDVNAESCDIREGCFDRNGNLCSDHPNERCDLATVPAGRCSAGNNVENIWPSRSGECEGTFGYFESGPVRTDRTREVNPGGIPCLTDTYAAALADFSTDPNRNATQVIALETVSGPSSMCPGNGTCAMKRCKDLTGGVEACDTNADCPVIADPNNKCIQLNDNSANCQAFDPKPSFCLGDPNAPCGIDDDCPKECVGGPNDGLPCRTALTECEAAFPNCPGQGGSDDGPCGFCVDGPQDKEPCQTSSDCSGFWCQKPHCKTFDTCSWVGNDYEPGLCGGFQARCSDGDPDIDIGGLGTSLCSDIILLGGRPDSQQSCGRNAGAPSLSSPRNGLENPPFLFTPQRDPGTGFQGTGVTRAVRFTSAVKIQDAGDAMANTLGIRSISTLGQSTWEDVGFSANQVNGALDYIVLSTRCNPPERAMDDITGSWETQLPVEGSCSLDTGIFCIKDEDCQQAGDAGVCENLFFCQERKDPNRPELGPALDSVAFLWQRDIVDHEPIPQGLPDRFRDPNGSPLWSTDPLDPTCPPLCGTEYDHTTFESEAITAVGIQDRASGIQLALDELQGRRAGADDMLSVDATTTVAFVNRADIRCQLGGQDPNDPQNLGTCTLSLVPCDPLRDPNLTPQCAPVETCRACGGRLIRSGDPLEATKGLNEQALPIGYDDLGMDVLKLVENRRLGVLNGEETTVTITIFVVDTTGVAAAQFNDSEPCIASGDRCELGACSGSQPGGIGIGSGGTFAAGQRFPHGGENKSGSPVSWAADNPCGPGTRAFVRLGTFAIGEDGIPGCIGNNIPGNNARDACRKRLFRGPESGQDDPNSTRARWGGCVGGSVDPNLPPPPCLQSLGVLQCGWRYPGSVCCPFHASCNGDEPLLEFNTGVDDPELLIPVVDEGLGPRTDEGAFSPGTEPRFVIPNPSDPAPTFHLVGAATFRDLDVLRGNIDNVDVVVRSDITSCPINLATGQGQCFRGPPPPCGDGLVDPNANEECDDSNQTSCDGCSSICQTETGFLCGDGEFNPVCDPECDDGNLIDDDGCDSNCTFTACGNGIQTSGEECDDGNTDNCDGCSDTCQFEDVCGNGVLDPVCEECDDGNTAPCDGCSADCQDEMGWICGDGVSNATCGEQCDDGNTASCDGCSTTCQNEVGLVCGDGIRNAACGEQCDDGNTASCDGCSADCQDEMGWICGDGVSNATCGEQCDDGNTASCDGCSETCQLEGFCGDGDLDSACEECDDGNTDACDGCSETCQLEGFCGDGDLDPDCEECDDGNNIDGDGCSAGCAFEPLDKAQQKCVNSINKGAAKVAKAQLKDIVACIKDGSKGELLGQTIEQCTTSDSKGKVAKAISKIKVAHCPTPPAWPPVVTDPNSIGEVMVHKELDLIHAIFGSDLDQVVADAETQEDEAKCQQAIVKDVAKCQDTKLKEFNSCKKNKLKGKGASQATSTQRLQDECMGTGANGIPDPKGKIAKKCVTKINDDIGKRCGTSNTDALFTGCASQPLQPCLDQKIECEVCKALNALDGLDRNCDEFDDGVVDDSCEGPLGTVTTMTKVGTFCVGYDPNGNPYPDPDDPGAVACSDIGMHLDCPPGPNLADPNQSARCVAKSGAAVNTSFGTSVITFPLDGNFTFDYGPINPHTGQASCSCEIENLQPQDLPGVGFICFNFVPKEDCTDGTLDCDGGSSQDVTVITDHDVGPDVVALDPIQFEDPNCDSSDPNGANPECDRMCDTYCASLEPTGTFTPILAACEGFCQSGPREDLHCDFDVDCPFGSCGGGDPVAHYNVCGCDCLQVGGDPAPAGAMNCELGVQINIEPALPCGEGIIVIFLLPKCVPMSTETTMGIILNANNSPGTSIGGRTLIGNRVGCNDIANGDVTGLTLTGPAHFLDSNIGDLQVEVTLVLQ